ncbi:MAG: energy-coupling factor transporter transmembrane protein EcfT [Tissierellia bacterium]|nr:energy-coupling factor transporter transmembrane protein EcfT [Tissierellia bacterium]
MNSLDPRTKLLIVLILSSLGIIYNKVTTLLFLLILAILIAIMCKSNLKSVFFRIKKLLYLLILISLFQSLLTKEGNPILTIASINILTDYGILRSLEFILRMGIIIVSAAIITTSSSRKIIQALIQLKVPYEIAFMVSIAIRFLPIFKEEMTDMLIALQLRGIDFKKIKMKEKIYIYKYIFLPITTNSIMKAKELAAAMEMRAFRAYPTRTSYMLLKMDTRDYLFIALSIVVLFITVQIA